ncbi:MAG: hypothetical protein AAGE89_11270 [Pseudomonadota bacterium]
MSLEIRDASRADIPGLVADMRGIDRLEARLTMGNKDLHEVMQVMFDRSDVVRTGLFGGRIATIYGRAPVSVLGGECMPWLASTTLIEKPSVRTCFIRHTKTELHRLTDGFVLAWNLVHEKNRLAIRWLKWAGFIFEEERIPVNGNAFLRFSKSIPE